MEHAYSFHLTLVASTLSALYVYRDVWPLMTFALRPVDEDDGAILWLKIALMIFIGVVEPLFEPYRYVPVDSNDPMQTPNPEQTACIMLLMVYGFLDPTVWLAYRLPHLSLEKLPPLCDYDYVRTLIERSYPVSTSPFRAGVVSDIDHRSIWIRSLVQRNIICSLA